MREVAGLIDRLRKASWHIAIAESCTGGLLAGAFTDVPGASDVFGWGFVCYGNDTKTKVLGVPEEILDRYGAVSKETAGFMASGALQVSGNEIALATTGIAGPGGATEDKLVGLVFVALADKDNVILSKNFFNGDRAQVREQTIDKAMEMLDAYLTHKGY